MNTTQTTFKNITSSFLLIAFLLTLSKLKIVPCVSSFPFRYSIKKVEPLGVVRTVGIHNFTASPKTPLLYDNLSSISEHQHSVAFATVLTAGHLKAQEKQGVILLKGGDGDGFMLNGNFISVRGPVARSPIRVSVGVLSTKGALQTREAIRNTWKTFRGNWSLTFILALPYDEELAEENKTHGDMMLASIKDHYGRAQSALPTKIASFYWWSHYSQHRPDWVFKTDDDAFLNIPRLFSILDNCLPNPSRSAVFAGRVFRGSRVIRPGQNGFDKWGLTLNEWPGNSYPPYCSGAGYLLSSNILPCFLRNLHVAERMPLEDVFTGVLASTCKVDPIHLCGIKYTKNERNVADSKQLLVHYVRETMIDIWEKLSNSTPSESCQCQ